MSKAQGAEVRLAPEIKCEYPGLCGAYFNRNASNLQLEILIDVPGQAVLASMDPEFVTFKGIQAPEGEIERLLKTVRKNAQQQPIVDRFPVLGLG